MALMADSLYEELATGVDSMDRFPIRGRVLLYSTLKGVEPRIIMSLINNESKGDPNNYLGDVAASGGPSIGPMQIYRKTAKDLGLWVPPSGVDATTERALYAAMSDDEDQGIRWGIDVFKSKLSAAGGDVTRAIAMYNGSGPAAQTYQQNALAFLGATYQWSPS